MDEEKILSNAGSVISLGGKEITIRGLPIRYSRLWRREAKGITEVMSGLAGVDAKNSKAVIKNVDADNLKYMLLNFADELAKLVGLWISFQEHSVMYKDKAIATVPEEDVLYEQLPPETTDNELLPAFLEVFSHAYPFGMTGSGRAKT